MEINLEEEVVSEVSEGSIEGRSLNERKRKYNHKKTNSEVEALVEKNDDAEAEAETTASDLVTKKF